MNHPNAQLYGVPPNGVGGTHMMYVLPEPPEVYGLPKDPKTPALIDLWKVYNGGEKINILLQAFLWLVLVVSGLIM